GLSCRHRSPERLLLGIPHHKLHVSEPTSLGVAADTASSRYRADGQSCRDENEDSAPESPSVFRTSLRKAQLTCSSAPDLLCRRALPRKKARDLVELCAAPR